jgi:hypothetical protein
MRAQKREMLREIERHMQMARSALAELDELHPPASGDNTMGAGGVVLDARVVDGEIVVARPPRTRRRWPRLAA